jgi:hypothetical protein
MRKIADQEDRQIGKGEWIRKAPIFHILPILPILPIFPIPSLSRQRYQISAVLDGLA